MECKISAMKECKIVKKKIGSFGITPSQIHHPNKWTI
jgi:hypothetical protein